MRSARTYAVVAVVLVLGALLGAVSLARGVPGATGSNRSSALNPEPGAVGGGEAKQTPLLMRVLDDPQPVKGSDGKYHLVYELVLTNSSPGTATVESVKTLDAKSGEVVGTLAGADIAARTTLLGEVTSASARNIGTGHVAILFLDVAFDDRRDVPTEVEHRVRTSFDNPPGVLFPEATTDVGARTEVLNKKPVAIGPPMRGKNWVVSNGCCVVSIHRGAVLAMDQKLLATERYAIDWIRADNKGHILLPSDKPTKLTDYPAYDQPILSVKGGKVMKVADNYPDLEPGVRDPELSLKDAPGNHVIVDIGGGRYAIYAHLVPGSITVQEGDHVGRGQVLGRLGNSGNSGAPHLHFHVMDAPTPLGADHNLPYVFDSYRYQGYIGNDLTPHLLKNPQPREDELPLNQSLVDFGAPRGN
jgi:Peptidase family M23